MRISSSSSSSCCVLLLLCWFVADLNAGVYVSGLAISSYWTGNIQSTERIVFFPTMANQINNTHWNVPIHGWIFKPENDDKKRKLFLKIMRKVLDIPKDSTERYILDKRVRPFVANNKRSKRPRIEIPFNTTHEEWNNNENNNNDNKSSNDNRIFRMSPCSKKNGHFQSNLILSNNQLRGKIKITDDDESCDIEDDSCDIDNKIVTYRAVTGKKENRIFEGTVQLVSPKGISVISDIDDTLKITNVFKGKKELMKNTFLKEFTPVPGMADVYQHWRRRGRDGESDTEEGQLPPVTSFHFVSSSVYQLYEDLESFRYESNYPRASFHLKTIRPKKIRDTLRSVLADPLESKREKVTSIIKRFPLRKFILVGDSGEKDPEVYAKVERAYHNQVIAIYIRNVNNTSIEDAAQRLEGVPTYKWKFFKDPEELLSLDKELLEHQKLQF